MAEVSYIIVNWNTRELLKQCLSSLIKEAGDFSREVLVVDNGSVDGSQDEVLNFGHGVRLIENGENLGFAKANNIGIKESTGKWICLVNSDIIVLDNCANKLIDYLSNNPDVGLVGPQTYNEDMSPQLNCRYFPTLGNAFSEAFFLNKIFHNKWPFRGRLIGNLPNSTASMVDVLSGCFIVTSRSVIEKVGAFDEDFFIYGEDTDWGKRMVKVGLKSIFLPLAGAIHIQGGSSAKDPVRFLKLKLRSDLLYFKKHHNYISYLTYVFIKAIHYSVRSAVAVIMSIVTRFHVQRWTSSARENTKCLIALLFFWL